MMCPRPPAVSRSSSASFSAKFSSGWRFTAASIRLGSMAAGGFFISEFWAIGVSWILFAGMDATSLMAEPRNLTYGYDGSV